MDPKVKDLRICIIGAGMGGLSVALMLAKEGFQDISVYESAPDLGFVGAGIQLAPNMARILDKLGVWDDLVKNANKTYGYPHMMAHRAELANALYEGCKRTNAVRFFFSTAADGFDISSDTPSFIAGPKQGERHRVEADILLGADGIKSKTRVAMLEKLGEKAEVVDTGQAAYRLMIKREDMGDDPELLELIEGDRAIRWVADKRMIIGYPVANKSIFNMSTAQPDTNFAAAPSATYTTRGSKTAMLSVYSMFCPKIQKLLNLVPDDEVCEWKFRVHQALPTWFHRSTALVGDACHPTLPHLAQGAAQAVEDAAVIGIVLSQLPNSSPRAINEAFAVYERVRKARAELLVDLAAAAGVTLHLGEGAAKDERDRMLAKLQGKQGESPDKWADESTQRMTYGHDCIQAAKDELHRSFQEINPSL